MGRIKHIEQRELKLLREQIIERFTHRNPTEALPTRNAYLPNYEDLKEDILDAVPDRENAVSENRLRKLFYYTNPKRVDKSHLKEANFGIDFLDTCYLYLSGGAADRSSFHSASGIEE